MGHDLLSRDTAQHASMPLHHYHVYNHGFQMSPMHNVTAMIQGTAVHMQMYQLKFHESSGETLT